MEGFATDLARQVHGQQLTEPAAYDRIREMYPRLKPDNFGALLRQALAATH